MNPGIDERKRLGVTLACLMGATFGSFYLYQDLAEKGGAGLGKPMAKIIHREAKVRRRPARTYLWAPVEDEDPLYPLDTVQTGPGSSATIVMNYDGSVLEIGENSLLVIDEPKKLAISSKDFGSVILKGSVILRQATGDSRLTVDSDGKVKVEEISIRLLQPQPLSQIFWVDGSARLVEFVWDLRMKGDTSGQSYFLEISTERGFASESTKKVKIMDIQSKRISLSLASGHYFWRISVPEQPLTESRQFRLSKALPLKPVSPSSGEKVVSWGRGGSIPFRWSIARAVENDSSVRHWIEVAENTDFSKPALSEPVVAANGAASLKGLGQGTYSWRIRSDYPGATVFSSIETFTVDDPTEVFIELSQPDHESSYELAPEIRFNWRSDSDAVDFVWEVQTAENQPVGSVTVKTKSYLWKNPPDGSYRWRVSAIWNGKTVGETPWRSFFIFKGRPIVLVSPKRDQRLYYWNEPEPFEISWEKDPSLGEKNYLYRLDLAQDREFKVPVISKQSTEPVVESKDLRLQPGSYYWRVSIISGTGQLVKTSEIWNFAYGVYPLLSPPAFALPESGTTFNVVEKDSDPILSWASVDGATAYELTISERQPFSRYPADVDGRVIRQTVIQVPRAVVTDLKEGVYLWTVRAIDRLKRRGDRMPLRELRITAGRPLAAPGIVSPEVQ